MFLERLERPTLEEAAAAVGAGKLFQMVPLGREGLGL
jgi:hypothetical protein